MTEELREDSSSALTEDGSDEEILLLPASPSSQENEQKRSEIHQHYTFNLVTEKYKCRYCRKEYKKDKNGFTGGLIRHIKSNHKRFYEDSSKKPPKSIAEMLQVHPIEPFTVQGFKKKFTEYIVTDDEPFIAGESERLQALLIYCNSSIQDNIPKGNAIRERVHRMFIEYQDRLKNELKDFEGKLSFVIDGWTSSNQYPFQGVMVRWINSGWELRETLLDLTILEGSHSEKNLFSSFLNALEQFELTNKLLVHLTWGT